jgi:spermidine/putrescine ABC transporter ATP-binding subunit
MSQTAQPFISFKDVTKQFPNGVKAVDGVSLDISNNEFFALLGPSGCGKSTLLRMLSGLEVPTGGAIYLGGEDITHKPAQERPLNMVFQSYAVFPHMSVGENVAYGLKIEGVPQAERLERVKKALEQVQLADKIERMPNQLSGGQRQRVALARALILRPKVLLLDEPLSALDKRLREDMQLGLIHLRNEVGITFIMVTHDQEEAMSMASRLAVMDKGKIAQIGTPKQLYEYPNSRFVADFLGSINFFPGKVVSAEGKTVTVETAHGRFVNEADFAAQPGQSVTVGVRPEMLDLDDANPDVNRLEGVAQEYAYYGDYNLCLVRLAGGQDIKVFVENDSEGRARLPRFGQSVKISWSATCGILLPD